MDDNDTNFPDPEDFKEEPARPPGPLSKFPSPHHGAPALIMFFLFYAATSVYNRYPFGDYLWLSGESIFRYHEYWRILTSLATHGDLSHLLSNALIFLVFGWMLKAYFGFLVFPVVSLVIGVATNCLTVAFYEPGIRLLGASGMAYGMVALWLVFYIHHDTDRTVALRIFRAVGFSLVMMFPSTFDPHVSYLAHAIGFTLGIVTGLALLPLVSVHEPS